MVAEQQKKTAPNSAQFRFGLSTDGMKLGINRYIPPVGAGTPPSLSLIKQQVAEAGVTFPVDEKAAKKVLARIRSGKEFKGITLVRGTPPQEPTDAFIEKQGDLVFPVFPGDCFAIKRPPQEAQNGQTINGIPLKPKSQKKPGDISVSAGKNCSYNPTDGSFVATVFGRAKIKNNEARVEPLLRTDKHMVTASCSIAHQDFQGQPITLDRIKAELHDFGVVIDIEEKTIEQTIAKAAASGIPQKEVVIVRGRYPVHGKDGWVEYLVNTRDNPGTEDEQGRLDFKDRGAFPSVETGQPVARLHLPTKGKGGIDIFGKTVPASEGHELHVHLGENVIALEDGITFQATAIGILILERNTLAVSECLALSSHVDMSTGNVRVDTGSVKVGGNVLAGFEVRAPQHIIVKGSIESATVIAGGDITVSGGILMPDGGMVESGGSVTTSYMNNGRVIAHGDILFKNGITNSTIKAFGSIIAERGKGIIQGGTAFCSRGMSVNELGSELGVRTVIEVNLSTEDDLDMIQERKRLAGELAKIDKILGVGDPKEILERTPAEKRDTMIKIVKHRINVAKRHQNIVKELSEKAEKRRQELAGVKIKVLRAIHPGVVIKMGGKSVEVKRPMERSSIYWDAEVQDIRFGTL